MKKLSLKIYNQKCVLKMLLTKYGQYYNYKVKNVPRFSKIVLAKCKDLKNALSCKNADEVHVEIFQSEDPHLGLTIVVQSHGQHVEPDEHHDNHVKLLVRHNPKNNSLWSPLKKSYCTKISRDDDQHILDNFDFRYRMKFLSSICVVLTWFVSII